jgi:hypothetical protein
MSKSNVDLSVKPEHLVLLRGFFCFVSLCQLVISINVSLPGAIAAWHNSSIRFSAEVGGCRQSTSNNENDV